MAGDEMNEKPRDRDQGAEAPDRDTLLEEIAAKRGYVLDMHVTLAEHDPEFLLSYDLFLEAAYLRERSLDRRTKELVYVAALAALGSAPSHQCAHMRAALDAGASERELLEVLEQVLAPAGVPRFIEALEAWTTACGGRSGATPMPEAAE
jgi:4-carboxymuconolactone decarboxylase